MRICTCSPPPQSRNSAARATSKLSVGTTTAAQRCRRLQRFLRNQVLEALPRLVIGFSVNVAFFPIPREMRHRTRPQEDRLCWLDRLSRGQRDESRVARRARNVS
jgi:hypothetical protein